MMPRTSGILLHISSLPGRFGIGDLGPGAFRFADFLADSGQHIWQVLPLVPVGLGFSPYSSPSTFAVNPLLISPELLDEVGLVARGTDVPDFPQDRVDFGTVIRYKYDLLSKAFDLFRNNGDPSDRDAFDRYRHENSYWLDDYALFMALKDAYDGAPWTEWPEGVASRNQDAMNRARSEHAGRIDRQMFYQFLFDRQWARLKQYCNDRSVSLFGDLPIYVAHDSADVWAHRDLFYLDQRGESTVVSGVPPDYFSANGQRWGNPIYRWELMRENDYAWWAKRFANAFKLLDLVRLDHFRGFAGYWEIPAMERTAINGRWVEGPGASLFHSVEKRLGPLPVVAENLGMITPDVTELMESFGFPGMSVLQFAFGEGADHPFLPHNLDRNVVGYTGTHDNDTTVGWWTQLKRDPLQSRSVRFAKEYLQMNASEKEIHWHALRAMMASPANIIVSPLQDILGLGSGARMNTPGEGSGNWTWRLRWERLTDTVQTRLKSVTAVYGRSDELDKVI